MKSDDTLSLEEFMKVLKGVREKIDDLEEYLTTTDRMSDFYTSSKLSEVAYDVETMEMILLNDEVVGED